MGYGGVQVITITLCLGLPLKYREAGRRIAALSEKRLKKDIFTPPLNMGSDTKGAGEETMA